jgi:hypothetical protein
MKPFIEVATDDIRFYANKNTINYRKNTPYCKRNLIPAFIPWNGLFCANRIIQGIHTK